MTEEQYEKAKNLYNRMNLSNAEHIHYNAFKLALEIQSQQESNILENQKELKDIEKNLENYFNYNNDIKKIVKNQIEILHKLLNYCKDSNYDSTIEIFYLKSNDFDSIKITDKNLEEEKVYLIIPNYIFPLSNRPKDVINYTIYSMGKYDSVKIENIKTHWFDENYNLYGIDIMDTEENFLTISDVLKSKLFENIINLNKVNEIEKILNKTLKIKE